MLSLLDVAIVQTNNYLSTLFCAINDLLFIKYTRVHIFTNDQYFIRILTKVNTLVNQLRVMLKLTLQSSYMSPSTNIANIEWEPRVPALYKDWCGGQLLPRKWTEQVVRKGL